MQIFVGVMLKKTNFAFLFYSYLIDNKATKTL